jgi:uncharacterized membrane protein
MTDHEMDQRIGALLRVGVIVAVLVTLGGGAWHLAQAGVTQPDLRRFHGEPPELRSVGGVVNGLAAGHAANLIQLGLLLLIATPIARVAFCVYAFAAQKDLTYVMITLIVLAALAVSLTGVG